MDDIKLCILCLLSFKKRYNIITVFKSNTSIKSEKLSYNMNWPCLPCINWHTLHQFFKFQHSNEPYRSQAIQIIFCIKLTIWSLLIDCILFNVEIKKKIHSYGDITKIRAFAWGLKPWSSMGSLLYATPAVTQGCVLCSLIWRTDPFKHCITSSGYWGLVVTLAARTLRLFNLLGCMCEIKTCKWNYK